MTLNLTTSGVEIFRRYVTDGVPASGLHQPDLDDAQLLFRQIEALVDNAFGIAVISRALSAPPASPSDGDRYIVGASPGGDWSLFAEGDLAEFEDGAWDNRTPAIGNDVFCVAEGQRLTFSAAGWSAGDLDATKGAAAGTGVTVAEAGDSAVHRTVLTLAAVSIAVTDRGAAGGQGSLKVYDFPAGAIQVLGASYDLTIARNGTGLAATAAVVGSLGSAAAAISDATLTSTEADIIASTVGTLVAGAGELKKHGSLVAAAFDGHSTPLDAYLNVAVPDAGISANDALIVNGTITILWANLGTY